GGRELGRGRVDEVGREGRSRRYRAEKSFDYGASRRRRCFIVLITVGVVLAGEVTRQRNLEIVGDIDLHLGVHGPDVLVADTAGKMDAPRLADRRELAAGELGGRGEGERDDPGVHDVRKERPGYDAAERAQIRRRLEGSRIGRDVLHVVVVRVALEREVQR